MRLPNARAGIDVIASWGASVLEVARLAPPRSFELGGDPDRPLVHVDDEGYVWLVVLPRAKVKLEAIAGYATDTTSEDREPYPYEDLRGATAVPFPLGRRAIVTLDGVVIEVEHDRAVELPSAIRRVTSRSIVLGVIALAALHAGLMFVAGLQLPPWNEATESSDRTSIDTMLLVPVSTVAETERAASAPADDGGDDDDTETSRCGEEHGGAMGDRVAESDKGRYGVEGPADNSDPHISRFAYKQSEVPWVDSALEEVGASSGDPRAPLAPWGRDDALGNDPASARAAIWGDEILASQGSPGIGSGIHVRCATCGDTRGGAIDRLRTTPGGVSETEKVDAVTAHRDERYSIGAITSSSDAFHLPSSRVTSYTLPSSTALMTPGLNVSTL